MDARRTVSAPLASGFARLVLRGIGREYPNALQQVLNGPEDLRSPRELHPAFFGCFDWHSAVHGHWLLARLLRLMPGLAEEAEIRAALGASLTAGNIAAEVAYLARPLTAGFERTYGWGWLLKLAEEVARLAAEGRVTEARGWSAALRPLTDAFVGRYLAYLPKAGYPIRTGLHANTAFGLAFAHDWAVFDGNGALRELVERKAMGFFGEDRDAPARLEPGGSDFLSPTLMEAELMRRVLGPEELAAWFRRFLPGAAAGEPLALFEPASVSDRGDLQIVHLDGLNLSRAWCMRGIAGALAEGERARGVLLESAERHGAAGLPHVCSGDYGGEHWLATYGVLMMTGDS